MGEADQLAGVTLGDGPGGVDEATDVVAGLHLADHGYEMKGSVIVLPFLLGCLAFGVVARLSHHVLRIPYTVLLLIGGVLVGWAHWADCHVESAHVMHDGVTYCETWMGSFGISMDAWSQINPNVIVGVFLPILLFESAFSVDFHIFRRSLGQILLLAVPGVLMSSALFGGFAVFFFSWEWPTAMMFGAILSATDPVAVVALMRDVGASKRLATLIEGESLINDGTAMLLFSLFKGMAFDGGTFSFSKVLLTFARLAGGGAVLGVVSSRLLAFILSHVYNDPIGETVLTLMFAYGTFFFAEYGLTMISHEAHVSGALAVVTFGLDMAYTGKLYISAQSEEALHSFWSLLEWLADSVIFCLTGVIISKVLVYKEETCADGVCTAAEHSITSSDWLNMLALYPVMHIVRAICLAVHWPCVNSQQAGAYQHSRGEFIVLLCSALRGAVGLSLAMEVDNYSPSATGEKLLTSRYQQRQILFYVCGATAMTLLINAPLIKPLIQAVVPTKPRRAEEDNYATLLLKLKQDGDEQLSKLAYDGHGQFSFADWWEVRRITFLHSSRVWSNVVGQLAGKEWAEHESVEHKYRSQPLFRVLKDVKQAEGEAIAQFNKLKMAEKIGGTCFRHAGKKEALAAAAVKEKKAAENTLTNRAGGRLEEQVEASMEAQVPLEEQLEARLRYYRAVKVKLIHMHESGFLSAGPARLLMEAVDETIDHSLHDYLDLELRSTMFDRDCESDWLAWDSYVSHAVQIPMVWQKVLQHRREKCWAKLAYRVFSRWIFLYVRFSYEVAQGYSQAQYHVLHEDLKPSAENHFFGLVNGQYAPELCASIETAAERTMLLSKAELRHIETEFPELVQAVQVRQACAITLTHQHETIQQLQSHGTLSDAEAARLNKKVNRGLKRMLAFDHHDHHVYTSRQMLQELPYYDRLFGNVDCEPGSEEVFAPHQILIEWNVPDTAATPKTHARTCSPDDIDLHIGTSAGGPETEDVRHNQNSSQPTHNSGAGENAFIVLRGQLRLSVFHNGQPLRDRMIDTSAVVGLVEMLHSVQGAGAEWGWRITAESLVTTWKISSDEIDDLCEETREDRARERGELELADATGQAAQNHGQNNRAELCWRLAGVFTVFAGMGHAYTLTVDSIEVARKFRGKRWGYLSDLLLDRGRTLHIAMTSEDGIQIQVPAGGTHEPAAAGDDDDTDIASTAAMHQAGRIRLVGTALILSGEVICDDGVVSGVGAFIAPHATNWLQMSPGTHLVCISAAQWGLMEMENESKMEGALSRNDRFAIMYKGRSQARAFDSKKEFDLRANTKEVIDTFTRADSGNRSRISSMSRLGHLGGDVDGTSTGGSFSGNVADPSALTQSRSSPAASGPKPDLDLDAALSPRLVAMP